jgi:CBS domain-containing protein
MRVSQVMTRDVRIASPGQTIREVANLMGEVNTGFLPVGENDKLVGTITDRDITLRAVAAGKGPDTPVREIMTPEVKYCFEDESLDQVAKNMGDIKVRRLPVMDRSKRLVGVIALGDMVQGKNQAGKSAASTAVAGASQPGGPHDQTQD